MCANVHGGILKKRSKHILKYFEAFAQKNIENVIYINLYYIYVKKHIL